LLAENCNTAALPSLIKYRDQKSILLLGEGHGRGLVECCRRFADAQITCVDASELMIARARRQLVRHNLKSGRVGFIHTDILNWLPSSKTYDLIVTNFFLDCFRPEQLEQMIPGIAGIAAP
jgi:spermidine synthase